MSNFCRECGESYDRCACPTNPLGRRADANDATTEREIPEADRDLVLPDRYYERTAGWLTSNAMDHLLNSVRHESLAKLVQAEVEAALERLRMKAQARPVTKLADLLELIRHGVIHLHPDDALVLDNDDVHLYLTSEEDNPRQEAFFRAMPADVMEEALTMLGLPWRSA